MRLCFCNILYIVLSNTLYVCYGFVEFGIIVKCIFNAIDRDHSRHKIGPSAREPARVA